ncbi:MAG: hypothetical protein NZM04_00260 [Methylacidiphilales bacterium]|nr:hypothetical protein [Candidatus Methylacidiphilales bacterium]
MQSVSENRALKAAAVPLLLNSSSSFFIDTTRNRVYSTVHGRQDGVCEDSVFARRWSKRS